MIKITKGAGTKIIDDKSSLLSILLEQGWVKEELNAIPADNKSSSKKKELKDAISSATGS